MKKYSEYSALHNFKSMRSFFICHTPHYSFTNTITCFSYFPSYGSSDPPVHPFGQTGSTEFQHAESKYVLMVLNQRGTTCELSVAVLKKLYVFFIRPNVSQFQQTRHKRRPNTGETLSIARTRRIFIISDSKDRETQE